MFGRGVLFLGQSRCSFLNLFESSRSPVALFSRCVACAPNARCFAKSILYCFLMVSTNNSVFSNSFFALFNSVSGK